MFKRFRQLTIIFFITTILISCQGFCADNSSNEEYKFYKDGFLLTLPNYWEQIPENILQEQLKILHETFPDLQSLNYDYGFQLKSSKTWFEYPYIVIQVVNSGKVSSSELNKISKQEIDLSSLEKNTNSFISSINVNEKTYDPVTHVIWMKMKSSVQGVGNIISITAMCLTKNGWIQLSYSAKEANYSNYEYDFLEVVKSIDISDSIKYKPDNFFNLINWSKVIGNTIVWTILGFIVFGIRALFNRKEKNV